METKSSEKIIQLERALSALRARVDELERSLAALAGDIPVPDEDEPIDLDIDQREIGLPSATGVVAAPAAEDIPEPFIEAEAAPVDEPIVEAEPAAEAVEDIPEPAEPVAAAEPVVVPEPTAEAEPSFESLFGQAEAAPAPKVRRSARKSINDLGAESSRKAVMDVMADRAAWLHDIPGPEVKSLRSAIGLGDQVVFIRRLFRDDPALYQDSIDRLGAMATLKEAIQYLSETFPEWDLSSDDVYRFMMAVRRKIRK